ncbi:XRE family transcriptional regulator [Burkholderia multivorans]|uniref:helix-turn-helix domain-containing protein n=1 Tax=Burkholderia multivorans TaxID=87883 RepID=UPI000D0108A2|nr:helix-turn-helix transcriptional regulator [Burkholderia multivorans]PRF35280.1 XRE family transcriptional regulator [Burkholderia multivorans]PRG80128.1 XRE family transcriptional regulator [Burkholderia multivorans]
MPDSLLHTPPLGPQLKRWRLLHRVKQSHAAELFGVAQSTISRWEAGVQQMSPDERATAERLLAARLDSAGDHALARLVAGSAGRMHLVCDLTHRLLACSPSRAAEFSQPLSMLLGTSLWRYATEEIVRMETALNTLGWHDCAGPPSVEFDTGTNASRVVPIHRSRCRWTRIMLSDGSAARLVETL